MMNHLPFFALLVVGAMLLSGCSKVAIFSEKNLQSAYLEKEALVTTEGSIVTESELFQQVANVDVVLIGETHDSAEDHQFQLKFLRWFLDHFDDVAFSMEHLERDEQIYADAYLSGALGKSDFIEITESANWAGKGSWVKWYQPMIDLAKKQNAPVVAANSPRRYSSKAYMEGLESLSSLPEDELRLFAFPLKVGDDLYRKKFEETVSGHEGVTEEMVIQMYAGQQIWDATMAESIVDALEETEKVLHIVGRFHVEEQGGLISQILARRPATKLLVILPDHEVKSYHFHVY